MSSSPESAAPLPDPKALRARAWSAGTVVFVSVAALVGCEAPEDARNGAREGEVLAQAQEALVCREGALDASKTFTPLALPTYADANATFSPPLNFKLPTQIPVTQGNSGHGRVVLTFATASGSVTCSYEGAHVLPFHVESELPAFPGDKYVFLRCSNGAVPGASVTTTSLNMHVKSSSFLAGATKVHLAYVEQQPCGGGFDCGAAVVDDGNACTADACDATTGVTHTPVPTGTSCADATLCNGAETCNGAGSCTAGTPLVTDDGNACTVDACNPTTGVTHAPVAAGTSCADATVCNGAETCDGAGACSAGTPLVTDDGNACTVDACNPTTGVTHAPAATGTSCADATVCNGAETCDGAGFCSAGTPLVAERRRRVQRRRDLRRQRRVRAWCGPDGR